MLRTILAALLVVTIGSVAVAAPVVVDFDDLSYSYVLTGSGYAGLTWEAGNAGYQSNPGRWITPTDTNDYPHSLPHNAINAWGCTLIGIGFPQPVDVLGAYFAAQGVSSGWTSGVRVHGYLGGNPVGTTGWFNDIDDVADWFAIGLSNVDRIVVESVPISLGGGWFGMDDLTYNVVPEPATLSLLGLGIAGLVARKRRRR
ncbi:MAG: PEP-CTERM sorting domain-containing protein [Anaerolineaceae bacterium]|nr:PEP-CTERM sorting domain-containing protein [Anaerolineaceae bacterium]